MKIYIVTSGEYSSYGINAVFLDRHKAETYCAKNIWHEPYYVEEYDTEDVQVDDSKPIYYGLPVYTHLGYIQVENGFVSSEPIEETVKDNVWPNGFVDIKATIPVSKLYSWSDPETEKIAQDWYAKYKAEKAGLT